MYDLAQSFVIFCQFLDRAAERVVGAKLFLALLSPFVPALRADECRIK
jgi:hypothetical protein